MSSLILPIFYLNLLLNSFTDLFYFIFLIFCKLASLAVLQL